MIRSIVSFLLKSSALLVVGIAILLALPHRDLDWEGTIVPLARQYNSNSNSTSTTSNEALPSTTLPLDGTIVVITGATSGIGYALTMALTTRLGATVVALGRSSSKLAQLQKEVTEKATSASSSSSSLLLLHTHVVDLANLADVARVGKELAQTYSHIDILINNAGMHAMHDMFAKDATVFGSNITMPELDRVFVVNYLSHVLLTEWLWPLLEQSTQTQYPIVAQMASSFHWAVDGSDLMPILNDPTLPLAHVAYGLDDTSPPIAARPGGSVGFYVYRTQRSYANSKLAQILHAKSLQERVRQSARRNRHVRVVSICPGWVATNIGGAPHTAAATILDTIAFIKHGWGIASTLMALFDNSTYNSPIVHIGDDGSYETEDPPKRLGDYYTNSKVFLLGELLFPRPTAAWMYRFGVRDFIAGLFAHVALVTQRVAPHAAAVRSSPESYNATLAYALNEWSRAVLLPYL